MDDLENDVHELQYDVSALTKEVDSLKIVVAKLIGYTLVDIDEKDLAEIMNALNLREG
jgi:hypothetical protein